MPYGRTLLNTNIVVPTRVSADGAPQYKPGGITIDLTTIPAAVSGSDVTLPDGSIIRIGTQYMRYGQIMTRIGVSQVQTITPNAAATAGTFTITIPAYGSGDSPQTTASLAYNATAAQIQAALNALPKVGPNGSTVSGQLSVSSGILTLTFSRNVGITGGLPAVVLNVGSLTTTTSAATVISPAAGNSGKFGPYDPAATDGRAVISRGNAYIMDETWIYQPAGAIFGGLGSTDTIGGVIEGGLVWYDRILMVSTFNAGSASLATGPSQANVEAAMPGLRYVNL